MYCCQGCPDPIGARQPGQIARRQPDFGPNRRSSWSAAGFRSQKPTPVCRVAGSHLQNPSNPNRPELQKNLTKSCKNKPDPARSRPNLERSRPDPAISSGIQPDPTKPNNFQQKKNAYFRKKSSFRRKFSSFW